MARNSEQLRTDRLWLAVVLIGLGMYAGLALVVTVAAMR